jgi:hypothetical protein
MTCNNCLDAIQSKNNIIKIAGGTYCRDCFTKYALRACPCRNCENVISLNGYDDEYDIEYDTCSICDTTVCGQCIINTKNMRVCKDCLHNDD